MYHYHIDSNMAHKWRSEDNFQKPVLSFHHGFREWYPGGQEWVVWASPTEHLTHWALTHGQVILKPRNNSYLWILLLLFCKKREWNSSVKWLTWGDPKAESQTPGRDGEPWTTLYFSTLCPWEKSSWEPTLGPTEVPLASTHPGMMARLCVSTGLHVNFNEKTDLQDLITEFSVSLLKSI